jgi:hypothetical protein
MKQQTLLSQRRQHEDRYALLTRSGFDRQASDHEKEILRLDNELLLLSRTEVIEEEGGGRG